MIRLSTLGTVDLRGEDGHEIRSVLAQPKRLALLAYLAAARPGALHRRDTLLALFWPDGEPARARNALSVALHHLKRSLGEGVIVRQGDEAVGLDPSLVWCDAAAFTDALEAANPLAALGLYRGDFLAGFFLSGSPEFERWVEAERGRLRLRALGAAGALSREEEAAGRLEESLRWARAALELSPYDEVALRRLVALLARGGEQVAALQVGDAFTRRLDDDLGLAPSPETVLALEAVRSGAWGPPDVAPALPDAPPSVGSPIDGDVEAAGPGRRSPRRVVGAMALVLFVALMVPSAISLSLGGDTDEASGTADRRSAPSDHRVAVFPFQVQAPSDLQYLGEGLMDLVGDALHGVGDLRRVDPLAVMSHLRGDVDTGAGGPPAITLTRARSAARTLGAGRYIVGSVMEVGEDVRVAASLYDVGGAYPVASASVTGRGERLPRMVEDLVRRLVAQVPLGDGARLDDVAAIHPADHEAFRAYLQGEALMRRGQYDSAVARFEGAVGADSTFALGWLRLGVARGWVGYREGARESFRRAHRFRDGLEASDRLLLDGAMAFESGDAIAADELARRMISFHPEELEGWIAMAAVQLFYRYRLPTPLSELGRILDHVLWQDPSFPEAVSYASGLAIAEGRYEDLRGLLARAPRGPATPRISFGSRVALAFADGPKALQDSVLLEMGTASESWLWTGGDYLAMTDSLRAAERVWRELDEGPLRSDWGRTVGRIHLAHLQVARGRWAAAVPAYRRAGERLPHAVAQGAVWASLPLFARPEEELQSLRDSLRAWEPGAWTTTGGAADVPPPLGPWVREYAIGLLGARLGDSLEAHRSADALEAATEPADPLRLREELAGEVRALFELERGRPHRALEILGPRPGAVADAWDATVPLFLRPLGRFVRAEALLQTDRPVEALLWYESFEHQPLTADYVLLAPAFLRKGEIYERRGDVAAAVHHYVRFLDRWQDADARYGLLIDDVRARVERLRGAPTRGSGAVRGRQPGQGERSDGQAQVPERDVEVLAQQEQVQDDAHEPRRNQVAAEARLQRDHDAGHNLHGADDAHEDRR